jgi:hypothetical protein
MSNTLDHERMRFNTMTIKQLFVRLNKITDRQNHIDYDKNNNEEKNFVILCKSCNGKVNFNRDQWEIGFKIFIGGSNKMLKFFGILPISNI